MKPIFLALALLLASVAPSSAVVTAKTTVTSAAWTDLGVGPLMLSFTGPGAYAVADTAPTFAANEGFRVPAGATVKLKTTSHVWVKATGSANVNAFSAPLP